MAGDRHRRCSPKARGPDAATARRWFDGKTSGWILTGPPEFVRALGGAFCDRTTAAGLRLSGATCSSIRGRRRFPRLRAGVRRRLARVVATIRCSPSAPARCSSSASRPRPSSRTARATSIACGSSSTRSTRRGGLRTAGPGVEDVRRVPRRAAAARPAEGGMAETVPATRAEPGGRGATTALRPMTEAESTPVARQVVPAYAADKGRLRSVVARRRTALAGGGLRGTAPQGPVDAGPPPAHGRRCRRRASGCSGSPRRRERTGASPTSTTSASCRRGAAKAMRSAPALDDERGGSAWRASGCVFGHNRARSRCTSWLGFVPTNISMFSRCRGGSISRRRRRRASARSAADYDAARALGGHPGVGLSRRTSARDRRFPAAQPGLSLVADDAGGALTEPSCAATTGGAGLITTWSLRRRRGAAASRPRCSGKACAGCARRASPSATLMVFHDNADGLAFWRAVGAVEAHRARAAVGRHRRRGPVSVPGTRCVARRR